MAWMTIHALLDAPASSGDLFSFGYGNPSAAVNYIDVAQPSVVCPVLLFPQPAVCISVFLQGRHIPEASHSRLLWHDIWVALALAGVLLLCNVPFLNAGFSGP